MNRSERNRLFEHYAYVEIDSSVYHTNPELRHWLEAVISEAGLESRDLARSGHRIYRDRATLVVFRRDTEGNKYVVGDKMATDIVEVRFDDKDPLAEAREQTRREFQPKGGFISSGRPPRGNPQA